MKRMLFLSMFFLALGFASCSKTTPDVTSSAVVITNLNASTIPTTVDFQIVSYSAATFINSDLFQNIPVTNKSIIHALDISDNLIWPDDAYDSIWIVTFKNGKAVLTKDKEGLMPAVKCN